MKIQQPLLEVDEENYQATPTAYARTIDSFLYLITRDRGSKGDSQGRKKRRASKEFSYIYFMYDPRSSFYDIPDEDERHKTVKGLLFNEEDEWEPDEAVEEASEDYKKAVETVSMRLLQSAYGAIEKIRAYLEELDLTKEDKKGKLKYSVKDVIKVLSDLDDLLEGLSKLEERIQKESAGDSSTRGGVEKTPFNT